MAARTVGNVSIQLSADTSKFRAKLKKATGSIYELQHEVKKGAYSLGNFSTATSSAAIPISDIDRKLSAAAGAVKGFILAWVGIGSVKAAITSISETMQALDSIAATAAKLGGLPDDIMALQYAARLNNVEIETLNSALRRMVRRASDAATGTGEAVAALKELGIDAQKFTRLPLAEKFYALADATNKVGSADRKLALLTKILDSDGTALVNMLSKGSEAMRDYAKEAKDMGLTMSATQAQAIDDATDAKTRYESSWQGFKNSMAKAFAGQVKGFNENKRATLSWATSVVDTFGWWFSMTSHLGSKGKDVIEDVNQLLDDGLKSKEDAAKEKDPTGALYNRILKTQEAFKGLEIVQKKVMLEAAKANGPSAYSGMKAQLAYWEQIANYQDITLLYYEKLNNMHVLDEPIKQMEKMSELLKGPSATMGQGSRFSFVGSQMKNITGAYAPDGTKITKTMIDKFDEAIAIWKQIRDKTTTSGALAT